MSGHFSAENIGHGTPGHAPTATPSAQPERFAFDAQSAAEIGTILAHYPEGREASAVIPLLYVAQRQMGRETGSAWVPRVAMDAVAVRLNMPPIRVYEVATFYLMFNTDGLFTMTEVECLGACANAPILQVNDDFYEDLDGPRTVALIEALRRGETPTPGSSIGRLASAPEGGRTTLLEPTQPPSAPQPA